MRKSRFTEAQIVGILRELDAGTTATELGRKHAIHANTIRFWKDRYGGLDSSDLVRLKQLEDESRRKDRIIARLSLEVDASDAAGAFFLAQARLRKVASTCYATASGGVLRTKIGRSR